MRVGAFTGETRDVVAALGGLGGPNQPFPIVGGPANIGRSVVSGLELSIESSREDGWRWSASYTPMRISDRFEPGFTVATTLVEFENTAPRHVVNASVGWSGGRWEADGFLRYQSRFEGVAATPDVVGFLEPISDFVTLDARLGYRLNDRLAFSISGQNLSQDTQRQTSGVDVERRIFGSVEFLF
jgi:iron complex outermembrane receptor protein